MHNSIRKLTGQEIISALDKLGISRENTPDNKGYLDILCPNIHHNDTHFGNCGINLNSGKIQCFACGYGSKELGTRSIYDLVKERLNLNFFDAFKFITGEEINSIDSDQYNLEIRKKRLKERREKYLESQQETKRKKRIIQKYEGISVELRPDDYIYTRERGYTEEFCKYFNMKHALSYPYENYFIIPIIDYNLGIFTFEARKLKRDETVVKYFQDRGMIYPDLFSYRKEFKILEEINGWRWNKKKYCVIDREEKECYDTDLNYIFKPKVLYPKNFKGFQTLFNVSDLDFSKPLYLTEGISSVSKIWTYITNNVSCLFGSNIHENQIEYLKQFPEIIIIPDLDYAGAKMSWILAQRLENIRVKQPLVDDTDSNFISNIIKASLQNPVKYALSQGFRP